MMARRAIAMGVGLVLLLPLLLAALVVERADTVFDADYLAGELDRVEAYAFLSDAVYPVAVAELLAEPDDALPEQLAGLDLPADAEAEAALLRLMRVVAPPTYVRAQTEQLLHQIVPYLRNDRDRIELRPAFDDRLRAAAAAPPGGPSELERAFRALGLGRRVVDRLIDDAVADLAASDPRAVLRLRLADRDDAAAWFTESVFGSLASILPYLTGDADGFRVEVSFAGREQLAPAFAGLLERPAATLVREGFVVTEADLATRLRSTGSVVDDPRANLEALQTGWTLTLDDLFGTDTAGRATRADVDAARTWIGRALGPFRWGLFGLVVLLAAGIGLLGGRSWPTRLLWGASALVLATGLIALLAGPVFDWTGAGALHDGIVDGADDWPASLRANADPIARKVTDVADRAVSGVAGEVLPLVLASSALVLVSGAWAYRDGRAVAAAQPPAPPERREAAFPRD